MPDFDDEKFQREAPERMRRLAHSLLLVAEARGSSTRAFASLEEMERYTEIGHAAARTAAALFAASYAGPVITQEVTGSLTPFGEPL